MALDSKYNGSTIAELVSEINLPKMIRAKQILDPDHLPIEDIPAIIREGFKKEAIQARVKPGMKVAITCGSRGVANIALVTKTIVDCVREMRADPFVFPAMGSHGGATAQGQIAVLREYGVTEQSIGCPIVSSMEVEQLGTTPDGVNVFVDKNARAADAIILCGRIKAHTAFQGSYESGIIKMSVIGMGKQHGAESIHEPGFLHMGRILPQAAKIVFDNTKIIAGIGLIENAFNKTCRIDVLDRDEIFDLEPKLLLEAKRRMGKIFIDNLDVLVVDRIGKDVSGDGMDPHITGRFPVPEAVSGGLNCKRIVALDLTEATQGNANGIGHADVTTKRVVDKFDIDKTYPNGITSTVVNVVKVPIFTYSDRSSIQMAVQIGNGSDKKNPRIVRIGDTKDVGNIWISQALLEEARQNKNIEILGEAQDWPFDNNGNLW